MDRHDEGHRDGLHNHFFWDEPRMFYMHVHGHRAPMELARKVKPALDLIGRAPKPAAAPSTSPATAGGLLTVAKLAQITGHAGEQNGAVYTITVGRDDLKLTEMGPPVNARTGLNTWAAFVGSDAKAAGERTRGHVGGRLQGRARPDR